MPEATVCYGIPFCQVLAGNVLTHSMGYATLVRVSPITLRVRELREAKGWSQAELARRAGVQRVTVTLIENHRTKGVDFETLEKLARALEVDPGYLIVKRGR